MTGSDAVGLEIRIDHGACMGSRECAFYAPGVFDHGDDGKAFVADVAAQPEDKILAAARCCPNFAIEVYRDGTRIS